MLKEPIFSKEFVFHDCMQLYWEYKLSVDGIQELFTRRGGFQLIDGYSE